MRGYYFITDSRISRAGNISDVKNALAAGVKVVQYREKYKPARDMYKEALLLRRICRKAVFLVNDRVDIALSVGADGVHLGREDIPYAAARKLLGKKRMIGLTVRTFKEALEAEDAGADYVGVGPVFCTVTKADAGEPVGTELVAGIKNKLSIPVAAIGGINLINAEKVIQAGADCLCAISSVVTKQDVKTAIRKFQALFITKGQIV